MLRYGGYEFESEFNYGSEKKEDYIQRIREMIAANPSTDLYCKLIAHSGNPKRPRKHVKRASTSTRTTPGCT